MAPLGSYLDPAAIEASARDERTARCRLAPAPVALAYHGAAVSSNSKRRRKAPILVVSNRLPVTLQRGTGGLERKRSTGGLVSALEPVLAKQGGTWVGWPGMKLRTDERLSEADDPYQMLPVELTDTEVSRYYHGLSNRTLWPLFHCFPERTRIDPLDWET